MKSRVGLKLTKFHSLLHMGYFIKEYGFPLKFFKGHLEEFLEHYVKKLYPRTTRQHSRYLYNLTSRLHELQCLDLWEEDQIVEDSTDEPSPRSNNYNIPFNQFLNTDNNSFLCGSKFKIVRSELCNIWHTHHNHSDNICTEKCKTIGLYHPWSNT